MALAGAKKKIMRNENPENTIRWRALDTPSERSNTGFKVFSIFTAAKWVGEKSASHEQGGE